jgi:hypothetical protein
MRACEGQTVEAWDLSGTPVAGSYLGECSDADAGALGREPRTQGGRDQGRYYSLLAGGGGWRPGGWGRDAGGTAAGRAWTAGSTPAVAR